MRFGLFEWRLSGGKQTLITLRQSSAMSPYLTIIAALSVTVLTSCAVGDHGVNSADTDALWQSTVMGDAFVELRCRGLSPDRAEAVLKAYVAKEREIRARLGIQRWAEDDFIPAHLGCPHYRGATQRYIVRIRELDRRVLGPQHR